MIPDAFEAQLRRALSKLGRQERTAFAIGCAERLVTPLGESRRKRALGKILNQLRRNLSAGTAPSRDLLDECMSLIPSEDARDWSARSEDACAATAYAIRSLRTGRLAEARSAAGRVFDSIEHALSRAGDLDEYGEDDAWMNHPRTLAEVQRQVRDLRALGGLTQAHSTARQSNTRLLQKRRRRQ